MFRKRVTVGNVQKFEALKGDVENLFKFHGYIDCSKAVVLYECIMIMQCTLKDYDGKYLNIPVQDRREIVSPEKFCAYIHNKMKSRYTFSDIKGRTLRDYYEKYMKEYSLEVVLSKAEIVRLFLYYYPYPECNREKATSLKVAKHWKATELAEQLEALWGYNYSISTCNKVLKEFYHFSAPLASVQPLKKRSQRNVAVLEWAFVEEEREGKRLKSYLPKYKFVFDTHAYQRMPITLSYSEADCVLWEEWVTEIERVVKTLVENWRITQIRVRRSCKNAEYMYERLRRNDMEVDIVLCD